MLMGLRQGNVQPTVCVMSTTWFQIVRISQKSLCTGLGAVKDVGVSAINIQSSGLRAILRNTAVNVVSDVTVDEEERKKQRAERPAIDPLTSLHAAASLSSVVQLADSVIERNSKLVPAASSTPSGPPSSSPSPSPSAEKAKQEPKSALQLNDAPD